MNSNLRRLALVLAVTVGCDSGGGLRARSSGIVSTEAAGGGISTGGAPAIFFDDFLGTSLDSSKWTGPFDRQGDTANKELHAMTPANVSVADGILSITAKKETVTSGDRSVQPPHDFVSTRSVGYTSGQIQMAGPAFRYGTISARLKVPAGRGVWPVFWLLGFEWQTSQPYTANVAGLNWPHDGWCETDIAEFLYGNRTQVNANLHWQSAGGEHECELPFNATSRFMVYRLQWAQRTMIWSVDAEDGKGFQTLRTVSGAGNVPNVAQYVVLSLAVGGLGGGTPNDADFPMTMQVDWVRVTQP
jgi:beta-glucanase (GH16 family)